MNIIDIKRLFIRRDLDHSWDDVDDAIDELRESFHTRRNRDWEPVENHLPELLLVREIRFLAARCREMDTDARNSFLWFLLGGIAQSIKHYHDERVSRTAHTFYIASLLYPMLSNIVWSDAKFVEVLIPRAKRELGSCRPRVLSSDYISERDLPLMRGEILELVLESLLTDDEGRMPRRSNDPEFCAWIGTHLDKVLDVVPSLIERRSMHPALIRELVENGSHPMIDGML